MRAMLRQRFLSPAGDRETTCGFKGFGAMWHMSSPDPDEWAVAKPRQLFHLRDSTICSD
jgi:hypothetical protein